MIPSIPKPLLQHRRSIQVRQRGPELRQLPFGVLDLGRDLNPLGLNRRNDMGNEFAHAPNLGAAGSIFLGRLRRNIPTFACAAADARLSNAKPVLHLARAQRLLGGSATR
jgi:hypothetical protein